VLFGFASFFQKRNHEKCTNMILEALKAKEKKNMCANICVCKHNGLYVQMHFCFLHLHENDDGH
jgi:hypothetical protein